MQYSSSLRKNKMNGKEITIKNISYKKTEAILSNIEIAKDAIKEFAYANSKGSCFAIDFFGEINSDFRAISLIGEEFIYGIDLADLDSKFGFGSFDIKKYINVVKYCRLLKFNQNEILDKILRYISYEKFEGGYFAKGKLIGKRAKDLKFIGVSGDVRNEALIKQINLDEICSIMPKLTRKNCFYVSKFL